MAVSDRSLTDSPRLRLRADERRESIIDAAWTVFARNGYHRASTQEIAALAGCSEPTIYKHFPSKQALFCAVLVRGKEWIKSRYAEVVGFEHAEGAVHDDPLGAWARVLTEVVRDPVYADAARLRLFALALTDDPEIGAALLAQVAGQHTMGAQTFQRAQEHGKARDDVDPDAAGWLFCAVSMIAAMRVATEGPDGLQDMPDFITTLARLLRPVEAHPLPASHGGDS